MLVSSLVLCRRCHDGGVAKARSNDKDDELLLFAYCRHRWGDAADADRSDLQYEDVATRLNDQFRHRFGEYTACAVRRYLQRLRSDARYR